MLQPGDLLIRKDKDEEVLAVSGGFLEVRPDKVIVLADACERADEVVDIVRAEEAKRRAQETMKAGPLTADAAAAEGALRRSLQLTESGSAKTAQTAGCAVEHVTEQFLGAYVSQKGRFWSRFNLPFCFRNCVVS